MIKLSKDFIANTAIPHFDMVQIKKALNRLGYYTPSEKTGITAIPDQDIFDALKTFQKDNGLTVTGIVKPDDKTIEALNKQANQTPEGQYIWRTVEDEKVRSAHSQYNRTIRAWSDSPDPGEDYNCRCWAEHINYTSNLKQDIISPINSTSKPWGNKEFLWHFFFGKGQDKRLSDIGLLNDVIEHAKYAMFDRVLSQISKTVAHTSSGFFTGSWDNSYDFKKVIFSLGGANIEGRFGGTIKKDGKKLIIDAKVTYEFSDEFTDPTSVRQWLSGKSDVIDLPPSLLGGAILTTTDMAGTVYRIADQWETHVTGSITLKD